jgi:hypothetical protein
MCSYIKRVGTFPVHVCAPPQKAPYGAHFCVVHTSFAPQKRLLPPPPRICPAGAPIAAAVPAVLIPRQTPSP